MNAIKTQGNFVSYGPQGERRAAFALEDDRKLFEAIPDLLAVCEALYPLAESEAYALEKCMDTSEGEAASAKAWDIIAAAEQTMRETQA